MTIMLLKTIIFELTYAVYPFFEKKVMTNDFIQELLSAQSDWSEPTDFFIGLRVPTSFRLPDNMLVFFHDFTAPAPNSHGRCTLVIPLDDMTYYLEHDRLELSPGDLLYIPPFALRFLHPDSPGYRRLFVTFDSPGEQPYLPHPGNYRLTDTAQGQLRLLLRAYHDGQTGLASVTLAHLLFTVSSLEAVPAQRSPGLSPHIERAIAHIERNFAFGAPLADIARHAGISESHLRLLFRRELGVSPGHYLRERRLNYAKHLLLRPNIRISDIATRCGFDSLQAFSAFFSHHAGCSPRQFRTMPH